MNTARTLAVALFCGALAAASGALAAEPDPAQALYDRGLASMNAGRFDEACPAFEQSYKLDPLPGALFTLAECEAQRGRLATAVARYDEYIALYATLPPDKKLKQGERDKTSRAQRAALAPKIAELTLVMPPGAPRDTQVTRDGAPLPPTAFGVPLPVDPGEHVITALAPDGSVTQTRVTLAAGEKKGIAVNVRSGEPLPPEGPKPEPPPEPAAPAGGPSKALIIAGAVTAGAGVALGGALMGASASRAGVAKALYDEVKTAGCPPASSSPTGKCGELVSAYASRDTLRSAGLWGFVGAGALGAGTLIYALAAPKRVDAAPRVLPVTAARGGGLMVVGEW